MLLVGVVIPAWDDYPYAALRGLSLIYDATKELPTGQLGAPNSKLPVGRIRDCYGRSLSLTHKLRANAECNVRSPRCELQVFGIKYLMEPASCSLRLTAGDIARRNTFLQSRCFREASR